MNNQATEMARRIRAALASGKLQTNGNYTIPALSVILGTTREELSAAVNREFGSITEFCQQIGFAGMKLKAARS